ncbi:MAG: porin family protein [Bacteroidota bacterium]
MKKAFFFALLSIICWNVSLSQNYLNGHPHDQKGFSLGFLMGLTYTDYNLKQQINVVEPRNGDTLRSMQLTPRPGINLGMITNFNLGKQLAFRMIPTISLEQRDFSLFVNNGDVSYIEPRKVEAAYVDLPFMFQFKTGYYKRTRVYVLAGGFVGVNLISNARVENDERLLKITTTNTGLTFGFGVNLYGDRIKLSPEILYKLGLQNVYVPRNTTFAEAISRLSSQVISININFE